MSSVDGEWDRDVAGDPLLPWGVKSGSDDGKLDHDGATNDGEVNRIGSSGGKRTTGAGGVSVIVEGDGESNGSLGDGLW